MSCSRQRVPPDGGHRPLDAAYGDDGRIDDAHTHLHVEKTLPNIDISVADPALLVPRSSGG